MKNQWTDRIEKLERQRDGLLAVLKRYETQVFGPNSAGSALSFSGSYYYEVSSDLILQTRTTIATVEKDK